MELVLTKITQLPIDLCEFLVLTKILLVNTRKWFILVNQVNSVNIAYSQIPLVTKWARLTLVPSNISFINWVRLVNTQLLWTSLCHPSELGRHYFLCLANSGMLDRHMKLSSSSEWAWCTLTRNDMKFCVTSKIVHN